MTEITDKIDRSGREVPVPADRGTIFFDDACGVCRGGAGRLETTLRRRGFILEPLQSPLAARATGASPAELMQELHVLTPTRGVLRGVDALLYIADAIPWARPFSWIAKLPGVTRLLRSVYRAIARRRYPLSATCGFADHNPHRNPRHDHSPLTRLPNAAPPALLITTALLTGPTLAPWAWMWTLAMAIYASCKWLTWLPARRLLSRQRSALYLVAYPGMDAVTFANGAKPARPTALDSLDAAINVFAGAALVWLIPRHAANLSPILAAWSAMIGLALLCHFGLLQLPVLALRRAGIPAEPLMRRPSRATSLAEFWGRRWNSGFRTLSHDWLFRPLARRGATVFTATGVVFLASGLLHDLVISLPARGGYGLPTLYFLIQFAGLLLERTRPIRRITRARSVGWLFTVLFTVAPMPLLFHHAFVVNVMLPFLHTIGGLP